MFEFFSLVAPALPDGFGVILSLSESPQQGGSLIERPGGGPKRALQTMGVIRQKTVGRVGMSLMGAELEGWKVRFANSGSHASRTSGGVLNDK